MVEIAKGNLVCTGEEIEVYDSGNSNYRSVTIEGINTYGGTVELEVRDNDTGAYLILEMEERLPRASSSAYSRSPV